MAWKNAVGVSQSHNDIVHCRPLARVKTLVMVVVDGRIQCDIARGTLPPSGVSLACVMILLS